MHESMDGSRSIANTLQVIGVSIKSYRAITEVLCKGYTKELGTKAEAA